MGHLVGMVTDSPGVGIDVPAGAENKRGRTRLSEHSAGLGMGLLFACMSIALQQAATEKHVGFAAAVYVFMHSLGQGIGVAVGGVVFPEPTHGETRSISGRRP